ncbi:uncharacterized protein PGTG_22705 [Puccinia graminis f. sp. tritici CRL 75-36-700-3]|uniref:Uncharacterized protein n=1 Tax=Puccinia graminis f. sp. tritici (strain CRL 75-36-700-3 / race SCCL) TaxID=418459 RepID=H6QVB8_PUCGT|nr:uncharacterized protein PGTG_22705 [Puccinia graminis f. sp. tritici CRL 75-36-700-3]EHS62847.1 hypothetical protein PGTG_22705 [Puccinia graminis f. sp. tritici CRL 75-36-700-3]
MPKDIPVVGSTSVEARMVVLHDPNSRGPQISLFLHRRTPPSSSELLSATLGVYIIFALVVVIIGSLLLVVVLQLQSRRIEERLQAVIAAHQPRQPRPRTRASMPTPCPGIPPSRRPAASFPSVSCRGSIPDSSFSDDSPNTDFTVPHRIPNQLLSFNEKSTRWSHNSLTFKFLDEPYSPKSPESAHSLP